MIKVDLQNQFIWLYWRSILFCLLSGYIWDILCSEMTDVNEI